MSSVDDERAPHHAPRRAGARGPAPSPTPRPRGQDASPPVDPRWAHESGPPDRDRPEPRLPTDMPSARTRDTGRPVRRVEPARGGAAPRPTPPRRMPADDDGPPTDIHEGAAARFRSVDGRTAVPRGKAGARPPRTPETTGGGPPRDRGATTQRPVRQSPPGGPRQSPPTERPTPTRSSAPPVPRRSVTRRTKVTRHGPRTLGSALLATLAAAVVPGTGLLMIRRRRAGALVLGVFLLAVVALVLIGRTARRAALVQNLLSSRVLLVVMVGLIVAGLAWVTQIVRTYALARPRGLDVGRRTVGVVVVAALCLLVATPFGFAANLVNSQRSLLDSLFGGGGGTAAAIAVGKPRLNVLLVGSDAGPDRTGARTDTMMLASIDTTTARTTLFALPRNIGYAQFPPGSPMAEQFPKGFHDAASPLSGNYLLNAVYAWGLDHPQDAPTTPTDNPGLNLLHQTVGYMLGVDIDYYVEVNMAGFASIIDAVGGVTVDVGPVPLPIGGVLPDGRHVKPSGYVPAGVQHLGGEQALWFARSRRDSDDYKRMGRQRCLLQSMLQQKSPTDVITHFQEIAAATTNSVSTNIPQEVLGALVALAGEQPLALQSISFDPNLPDPNQPDGHFNTSRVDIAYMRQVVQEAFAAPAPAPAPTTTQAPPPTTSARASRGATPTPTVAPTAAPAALSCG